MTAGQFWPMRQHTETKHKKGPLLVVFGGREASSKSSRSVPCIVRNGTIHHFGGGGALCGAP